MGPLVTPKYRGQIREKLPHVKITHYTLMPLKT